MFSVECLVIKKKSVELNIKSDKYSVFIFLLKTQHS